MPSTTCESPRADSSEPVPELQAGPPRRPFSSPPTRCSRYPIGFGSTARRLVGPLPPKIGRVELIPLALFIRSVLTWSGVSTGLSCSRRAASPATTAEACDVPEAWAKRSPIRACGFSSRRCRQGRGGRAPTRRARRRRRGGRPCHASTRSGRCRRRSSRCRRRPWRRPRSRAGRGTGSPASWSRRRRCHRRRRRRCRASRRSRPRRPAGRPSCSASSRCRRRG